MGKPHLQEVSRPRLLCLWLQRLSGGKFMSGIGKDRKEVESSQPVPAEGHTPVPTAAAAPMSSGCTECTQSSCDLFLQFPPSLCHGEAD